MIFNLLLLYDSDKHHYVLLQDHYKFYCFLRSVRYRGYPILGRDCFWLCYDCVTVSDEHVERCNDNSSNFVRMPSENSNIYKLNKWSALWFPPLVIYFDFESFLRPVSACSLSENVSSSSTIEIHEPCGFALTVVQHNKQKPKYTHLDSSENCL